MKGLFCHRDFRGFSSRLLPEKCGQLRSDPKQDIEVEVSASCYSADPVNSPFNKNGGGQLESFFFQEPLIIRQGLGNFVGVMIVACGKEGNLLDLKCVEGRE